MITTLLNYLKLSGLIFCIVSTTAKSWTSTPNFLSRRSLTKLAFSSISPEKDTEVKLTNSVVPPSWDDLSTHLKDLRNDEEDSDTPLITLYRDTNGWCPFCERVWFALKIKNIPYQETLISLFDKPKWFVDMVPTGLVPVVLIHTDTMKQQEQEKEQDESTDNDEIPPQRVMIWESSDILKALDEYFPDTPKLVLDDDEKYVKGEEILEDLTVAGFKYVYNMRNDTLTDEEKVQQRKVFEEQLDVLDDFIGQSSESPFFLNSISALDVKAVPNLERWRYQIPLIKNMDITEGRSNLQKWFDAMDKYEPYIDRVGGDQYSWTAVCSTFLKLFSAGKDGVSEETKNIISKVDKEAEMLRSQFDTKHPDDNGFFTESLLEKGKLEAATKLISNHEAIVKDSTNKDPSSQKELGRAVDEHSADWVLRFITSKLLNIDCNESTPDEKIDEKDAAKAAQTVACRLSVPRDMGAPAAAILRHELAKTASALDM